MFSLALVKSALEALYGFPAHFLKHAAEFGLKHNEQCDETDADDLFENKIRRTHLKDVTDKQHEQHEDNAERELARTSVLHELESVVKEKRNNDNIDDISEADRAELIRYYVKIV